MLILLLDLFTAYIVTGIKLKTRISINYIFRIVLNHIPKAIGTKILVNTVTNMMAIKSKGIPALAIAFVVTNPDEYTIALGGVPTGIMKP